MSPMTKGTLADLLATNRIFEEEVVGQGDFGALDRVYTADARILPPGAETITGLAGIKAFWAGAAVTNREATIPLQRRLGESGSFMNLEYRRSEEMGFSPPQGVQAPQAAFETS